MSLAEEIEYTERVKPVKLVRLGILSPERILKQSVAEIYKPVSQNELLDGTLMDPRLGTNDKSQVNRISELDYKHDPGNFGHLWLSKPVVQIKFYDQIIKTLKCVCYKCSHLLVDRNDPNIINGLKGKKGKHRFKYVKDLKKASECPNCGTNQPAWGKGKERNRVAQIVATFGSARDPAAEREKVTFNTEVIYYILKNITDEDCILMGYDPRYTRPDWMIWTVMPIPPPTMRPTIKLDNGQSSEDDLTSILNDIIKTNVGLAKSLQKNSAKGSAKSTQTRTGRGAAAGGRGPAGHAKEIVERWSLLQLNIAAYINNEQTTMDTVTNRSNRPLKTLRSRIEAKKGRVRNNLMGKRVDYTARTVITADPNISINQLGIPLYVAMTLDYKEVVTEANLTTLHNLVQNGPTKWPGANAIRRRTRGHRWSRINLEYADRSIIKLRPGDIVYRHLMDGDWILFNRQPSLHKMSMMAHRAKVLKQGDTFRLNVSVTSPYNADFDGDEMNLHCPRSYQTRVELEELAAVPTQVVSPQGSNPVMGLVQDSMLACFRWTMSKNYLNYRQVMHLLAWTSTYNGTIPPPDFPKEGLWKAHTILSTILPKFTLVKKSDEEVESVEIIHGKFNSGIWSKASVGGKISNIIHAVWKDYGPETTRLFMDNIMNLTMQWLLMDGFSIGMRDTVLDPSAKETVDETINSIYDKVSKKISDLREGKFKVKFSNIGLAEHFENEMFELVNQIRDKAQSASYNSMGEENRMWATVTSGSKGSKLNVVQISSLLGQRTLEGGKRVHGGYSDRTLPHYAKFDLRPESHGLILSNYIDGLNPVEYFMDAMSGREGVISTAIKTATTGYEQRKLIKVTEDLKVFYDNTVRNANNFIISHVYATDSFDASKLEKEYINYFNMDPNGKDFKDQFVWTPTQLKNLLTPEAYAEWISDVKNNHGQQFLDQELKQILEDRRVLREDMYKHLSSSKHGIIWSPVKFSRLLDWIKYTCSLDTADNGDISPLEVIQKTNALIKDMKVSHDSSTNEVCTRHFRFLVRNYLNSKRLISEHKFNRQALDLILLKIKEHYENAMIDPGEMVGTIAAQSIGERLTQLTLDSFHKAGTGGRSKKLNDVPRVREITSATSNPKTPYLNIYISSELLGLDPSDTRPEPPISHVEAIRRCELILDQIQYTTLNSLIENYQIFFDPIEAKTIVEEDQKWLAAAHDVMGTSPEDTDTPWLLRFEFNSAEKIQNMNIREIANKIEDLSTEEVRLNILHTPQNSPKVIMRIRVSTRGEDPKKDLKDLTKKILLTAVKGIPNVTGGAVDNDDMDITIDNKFISLDSAEYRNNYKFSDSDGKEIDPRYQQYMIQTEGTNLYGVLALDGIDTYRTRSNDLHESLEVLGIEAVREMIIQEIVDVFAYGGITLNNRHFGLLADVMTAQGYLVSIDRYGVSKTDTGILSRATFETTTNQVANAAIFGEEDPMRGVSANIMFGQFFKGGTNAADVLIDEEMIVDNADKMFYPKRRVQKRTVEYQETETLASCQNLDFEFSL